MKTAGVRRRFSAPRRAARSVSGLDFRAARGGAAGAAGVAGAVERTDGCAGTMTSTGSGMAHGAIAKPTGCGIGIANALANAMCWSAIICCCTATICA